MPKKILLSLLAIFIIIGIVGFVGYKLLNKKVAGVQDVNSKIIGTPKDSEFESKSSIGSNFNAESDQSQIDTDLWQSLGLTSNTTNYNKDYPSSYFNSDLYLPLPQTSTYKPAHSEDYWNALIKQAEEEAQKSKEELKNYEDCLAFKREKDAAFSPLKQAINDLRIQYINADEIVTERTKGHDVSEAQRQRLVEVEKQNIQSQIDYAQAEYDRLYAAYGSC